MSGYCITGTDTDVGKTIVSSILMHYFSKQGRPVCYHKPVQTGSPTDMETVQTLTKLSDDHFLKGIYFRKPLSPHLSAHYDSHRLEFQELLVPFQKNNRGQTFVIEGAGGLLVPLNERFFMADLFSAFKKPVIVVAQNKLGTINHTLLTLKSLRLYNLPIKGVVMVGPENKDNTKSISFYGKCPILFEVPLFKRLNAEVLAEFAERVAFE